jgi:hypothetical protein
MLLSAAGQQNALVFAAIDACWQASRAIEAIFAHCSYACEPSDTSWQHPDSSRTPCIKPVAERVLGCGSKLWCYKNLAEDGMLAAT